MNNASAVNNDKSLRLAIAKTLSYTGIIQHLVDEFHKKNPNVEVIIIETGALRVLELGRDNKADLLISHHPPSEKIFIEARHGLSRTRFIDSQYAIFGPPDSAVEFMGLSIYQSMKKLYYDKVDIYIPHPRSGTFRKIQELWSTTGITPTQDKEWDGYTDTESSSPQALMMAANMEGFTIADMGYYYKNFDYFKDNIIPIVYGGIGFKNTYSIIKLNPNKHQINVSAANVFYNYLVSNEAQKLISDYSENAFKHSFLFPSAALDTGLINLSINEKLKNTRELLNSQNLFTYALLCIIMFFISAFFIIWILNSRNKKTKENEAAYKLEKEEAELIYKKTSEFYSNLSHEIRNPLQGVLGTLRELKKSNLNNKQISIVKMLDLSVNNMTPMINSMIELSRIDIGNYTPMYYEHNIINVLLNSFYSLYPNMLNKNLYLKLNINPLIPQCVLVDPVILEHVFQPILSNAIKYTNHGGISIHVTHNNETKYAFTLKITFTDTGEGITEKFIPYIFERYTREINETSSPGKKGTGLGMNICKTYIDLLKGDIKVKSKKGDGTAFTVSIPIEKSKNADLRYQPDRPTNIYCYSMKDTLPQRSNYTFKYYNDILLLGDDIKNDNEGILLVDNFDETQITNIPDVIPNNTRLLINRNQYNSLKKENIINSYLCILDNPTEIHITNMLDIASKLNAFVLSNDTNQSNTLFDNYIAFSRFNILLVEDDIINSALMKMQLENIGHQVKVVDNGVDGLKELLSNMYELCILDFNIPSLKGIEVLRKSKSKTKTPIVLLTGETDKEKICLENGAMAYLIKPIDYNILASILQNIEGNRKIIPNTPENISPKTITNIPNGDYINWDRVESLQNAYGNDYLRNLIALFYDETKKEIEKANNYLRENELEKLRASIHKITGRCLMIGCNKLTENCKQILNQIEINNEDRLNVLTQSLQDTLIKTKASLNKHLSTPRSTKTLSLQKEIS